MSYPKEGLRRCSRKFDLAPDPSFSPVTRMHEMMASRGVPTLLASIILNPWMPLMCESLLGDPSEDGLDSFNASDGSGPYPIISTESEVPDFVNV